MSDCSTEWKLPKAQDREPGVLYCPHADVGGVRAIDVRGERFERVRECEVESSLHWDPYHGSDFYEHKFSCGHTVTSNYEEPPFYCDVCGAKVKVGA